MKTALYKIHKWVGLALGLLLFLQALTGLVMVHKEGLEALTSLKIDDTRPHQSLDRIIATAVQTFPKARLERLIYAKNPRLPLTARMMPEGGGGFRIVKINPATATVISAGPVWQYPLQLAERVHVSLLSGKVGHAILFIEAVALVFMAISGLVVWWPRKNRFARALKLHWKSGSLRLVRDLHMAPGALVAILMLVSGLTGALIVASSLVKPVVAALAPVNPPIRLDLPTVSPPTPKITWQQAFDRLKTRFPDGRLRQLRFMGGDSRLLGTVMVAQNALNPRAHDIAVVDRWADKLVVFADGNALPAGSAFLSWILPIHTGEAYGPLRPVLMTVLGLTLASMAVTGLMIWLQKRRPAKAEKPAV